ncbi:holo-[acyl-carrier protein] synthase [Bacillus ectoiniformans]|uniref:holo-ACP synthase n=1 Tax=Bacillus ectoiniformans TaxID=1494429 RepID=UPI001956F193|nr:holo-ACP synthase [Bacillus ectoiniformans]MBM7649400.1 holo-[acyl-carrier protein] synthase [Bacillus ectoiniformans]
MIKGIGMDIVELQRIKTLVDKKPKFIDRILTPAERKIYESRGQVRRYEYAAGRFAAKEAFAKAMGTGIGGKLSFQDIEIDVNENGKPFIKKPFSENVHLSITHTKEYAAAQVVIEKE